MNDGVSPDVAIVGAGPAGLGAAIELRRRGVEHVLVLEREVEAGGTPRHCGHPAFGIREFRRLMNGPAYARRLRAIAVDSGVDIRVRHSVVALQPHGVLSVATPDGAVTITARRVILATGARERPRSARLLSGERPTGIINTGALQACVYLKDLRPFRRPIIVGTELVSLSAIWTCLRNGMRPAAVIEAGANTTVRWPLGLFPRLFGIPVHLKAKLTAIMGAPRVQCVEVTAANGGRVRIPCDGVVLSGQFLPEAALLSTRVIEIDSGSGGPRIDQFGRCSDSAYFAVGNLLRPIETAGWCYREARRIGAIVAEDLAGRLAPHSEALEVLPGEGVKFAVPQRVVVPNGSKGLAHIQLRAAATMNGRLIVRYAGKVLWSRRLSARLERRILIPLAGIALPRGATRIVVSIEADH